MLGHLVSLDHRADGQRDLGGATQWIVTACDGCLNAGEIALGGGEQLGALAAPLCGEIGIAALHRRSPGTRVPRWRPCLSGRTATVATRRLPQRLDRRRAQRGDPVQACRCDLLGDACLGDHPAIADQHHCSSWKRRFSSSTSAASVIGSACRPQRLQWRRHSRQQHRAGRRRSAARLSCRRGYSRVWPTDSTDLHAARRDIVEHRRPLLRWRPANARSMAA